MGTWPSRVLQVVRIANPLFRTYFFKESPRQPFPARCCQFACTLPDEMAKQKEALLAFVGVVLASSGALAEPRGDYGSRTGFVDRSRRDRVRLWSDLRKRTVQRHAREVHDPLEGLVELEDEENRAGDGQCANQQGGYHRWVWRREHREADEQNDQPEDQHEEEWQRNRTAGFRRHQYSRSTEIGGDLECMRFRETLAIGLRL